MEEFEFVLNKNKKESFKRPILIIDKTAFINSPITYHYKGKFYKGNTETVNVIIHGRNKEEPSDKDVRLALKKFNNKYKNTIILNRRVCTRYGNWVYVDDMIIKPKL